MAKKRTSPVWNEVLLREALDSCYSIQEVILFLGLPLSGSQYMQVKKACAEFGLPYPRSDNRDTTGAQKVNRISDSVVFSIGGASKNSARRRFYALKLVLYVCAECGLVPFWNGKELTLALDHINGNNKDNRIENLRWLCPNCHSQTETFGTRNRRRVPPAKSF